MTRRLDYCYSILVRLRIHASASVLPQLCRPTADQPYTLRFCLSVCMSVCLSVCLVTGNSMQVLRIHVDLGATLVCQYDPTWYKSDPKSTTCTLNDLRRLGAKNNRLSTSSRLLTW